MRENNIASVLPGSDISPNVVIVMYIVSVMYYGRCICAAKKSVCICRSRRI